MLKDKIKAEAAEAALRVGVSRTRDMVIEKFCQLFVEAACPKLSGETPEEYQKRLLSAKGGFIQFAETPFGKGVIGLVLGVIWEVTADMVEMKDDTRRYADRVASQLRVLGMQSGIQDLLEKVVLPTVKTLGSEMTSLLSEAEKSEVTGTRALVESNHTSEGDFSMRSDTTVETARSH